MFFITIQVIFDKSALTNEDLKEIVAAYSVPFIFRVVPIAGDDNQCLQFALSKFCKDVDESSKTNVYGTLLTSQIIQ